MRLECDNITFNYTNVCTNYPAHQTEKISLCETARARVRHMMMIVSTLSMTPDTTDIKIFIAFQR